MKGDYRAWTASEVNNHIINHTPIRTMDDVVVDLLESSGSMMKREEIIDQICRREVLDKNADDVVRAIDDSLKTLRKNNTIKHPKPGYYHI